MTNPTLLSIQSWVSWGHVGHGVAQFTLGRLGIHVAMLPTVMYSSHLGYKGWRGGSVEVKDLKALCEGLENIGVFNQAQALLTGFLGTSEHVAFAEQTLQHLQTQNRDAMLICDPVLGDHGALYLPKPMVEAYRSILLPLASVITPNRFELGWLAGLDAEPKTVEHVHQISRDLLDAHPSLRAVVTTGCTDDTNQEALYIALVTRRDDHAHIYKVPKIDRHFAGAGDLFSATLTAQLLHGKPIEAATHTAACIVTKILQFTAKTNSRELALIASQSIFDTQHDEPDTQLVPHSTLLTQDSP